MSRTVAAPVKVAVAYSGGRDSTALLHATAKVAREQGYEVAPTGGLPRFVYEAFLARRP